MPLLSLGLLARSCQYWSVWNILSKYSILLKTYGYLHILASALTASVSENWHSANPLARSCQYQSMWEKLSKYSTVLGIFTNCPIFATALPQSRKSGIWQFHCHDLVNINVYTKFYLNVPYCWKPMAISIFQFFLLCHCLSQRNVAFGMQIG